VTALSNPNRDREANRRRAEAAVAAGRVEMVSRGTLIDSLPARRNVTAWHALALTCAVLAAPAFLLPVVLGTGEDGPAQSQFWAIGAAVGLFTTLVGGGALFGLAYALRRRALPAEVSTPTPSTPSPEPVT